MKKMRIGISLFLFVLLTPYVANADEITPMTEGWQTILSDTYTATPSGVRTPIVSSGGGDIRLCINGVNANNTITAVIMSDNGAGDGVDDQVVSHNAAGGPSGLTTEFCFPKDDARPYVDGSNGKAEFYVKITSRDSSDTVSIKLQD